MNRSHTRAGLILAATLHLVAGCDDDKPNNHYALKEVIDVEGTCWENHVGRRDSYAGQIVRWRTVETGVISTYGFISFPLSERLAERTLDEVTHPTVYHTPSMILFERIDIDTNQPKWILNGVSDRGENAQGYDSTCEVEVVKRGTKLSEPEWLKDKPSRASPESRGRP